MKAAVTRCALWASLAASIFCTRSLTSADHDPPPEIPIQQWLQDPDRRDFDWKVTIEQRERDNQAKRTVVDVSTLTAPKPAPDRYARFMDQILAGTSTCDVGQQPLRHVLVVVSDALPFFTDMETAAVQPQSLPGAECYHLELDRTVGGVRSDQMEGPLKSLHPTQVRFKHAAEFRGALAHIISDIKRAGRSAAAPSATH